MHKYATIPVINGLSDLEHPCQLLADIMTMQEHFGSTQDLKVAWVGDGNNVCNSLILSTVLTGLDVTVATPEGYEPAGEIVAKARSLGGKVTLCPGAGSCREGCRGHRHGYVDLHGRRG